MGFGFLALILVPFASRAELLPVLECRVRYVKGNCGSTEPPRENDTVLLDSESLLNMSKQLEFVAEGSYHPNIPFSEKFEVPLIHIESGSAGVRGWRLISEPKDKRAPGSREKFVPERRVAIDVKALDAGTKPKKFEIWIVTETHGSADGIVVLEGTRK
jgi:hypothetical protein